MAEVTTDNAGERSLTNYLGASDPSVRVTKFGFIEFATNDLPRLLDHYTEGLQFKVSEQSRERTYLTTGLDHHSVVISTGEPQARTRLGFEIQGSLDDAEARLARDGITVERRSNSDPGVAESLVIQDPAGTALHLYESQTVTGSEQPSVLCPSRLGHVASHVPNLQDAQVFYEDTLGFRWSDTIDDWFAFMRCGPEHHAVNFMAVPGAGGRRDVMNHVAYELRDITHMRDLMDHLARQGRRIYWGPGRHGPGYNIATYHYDPDGNRIELFTELDVMLDERLGCFEPRPWHREFPRRPSVWVGGPHTINSWGTEMEF